MDNDDKNVKSTQRDKNVNLMQIESTFEMKTEKEKNAMYIRKIHMNEYIQMYKPR